VHNNARIPTSQSYAVGEDTVLTQFHQAGFAGFARALGANGFMVRRPGELAEILPEALAAKKTAVIDRIIDPAGKPPVVRS
jgi:thiamine pyrophosphate-dependent acetolactate synthase large subunit-like protein